MSVLWYVTANTGYCDEMLPDWLLISALHGAASMGITVSSSTPGGKILSKLVCLGPGISFACPITRGVLGHYTSMIQFVLVPSDSSSYLLH